MKIMLKDNNMNFNKFCYSRSFASNYRWIYTPPDKNSKDLCFIKQLFMSHRLKCHLHRHAKGLQKVYFIIKLYDNYYSGFIDYKTQVFDKWGRPIDAIYGFHFSSFNEIYNLVALKEILTNNLLLEKWDVSLDLKDEINSESKYVKVEKFDKVILYEINEIKKNIKSLQSTRITNDFDFRKNFIFVANLSQCCHLEIDELFKTREQGDQYSEADFENIMLSKKLHKNYSEIIDFILKKIEKEILKNDKESVTKTLNDVRESVVLDVKKAVKLFDSKIPKYLYDENDYIIIKEKYYRLEREKITGVLNFKDQDMKTAQFLNNFLTFITLIEGKFDIEEDFMDS